MALTGRRRGWSATGSSCAGAVRPRTRSDACVRDAGRGGSGGGEEGVVGATGEVMGGAKGV